MEYRINLRSPRREKLRILPENYRGKDPLGNEIGFTNYYMTINGKAFFAVVGECHFSRVKKEQWEDTILKMKMGGLNTIATYLFWNHHEEKEGLFRFDGNRDLREFIGLCQKHGMYVIVRIGPFCHGEVRNGGLPDWIYGKPFEARSLSEGWLSAVRRIYHEYAGQLRGLFYKDGGPVIAAQIENEYMHSAAPWEMTTGVSNEWVPGGEDGAAYMSTLKRIAQEEGIVTPFYTCTGWGGAAWAPGEMLPLWGGYAYWPWIFYGGKGTHPATPEYIYRDFHNNQVPETYNFQPAYAPEDYPYACCEMGGGMQVYYNYRFQLPFESVDAMANIKMAGGCNFLGYYMYRGGTNPKGENGTFLNECQCPKLSYDYQAPIGEFGQLRPSYHRLKALHLFAKHYQNRLCSMTTVLPGSSQDIAPEDTETLRYAVRTDGTSGFVFLNNFQDHCDCRDKENETITLELSSGEIRMEGLSLAAGEEAILPFGLEIGGAHLLYATAQPLSILRGSDGPVFFFFAPEGMPPKYVWAKGTVIRAEEPERSPEVIRTQEPEQSPEVIHPEKPERSPEVICAEEPERFPEMKASIENCTGSERQQEVLQTLQTAQREDGTVEVIAPETAMSVYSLENGARIVTLTRQQSLMFCEAELPGKTAEGTAPGSMVFLSDSPVTFDGRMLRVENPSASQRTSTLRFWKNVPGYEALKGELPSPTGRDGQRIRLEEDRWWRSMVITWPEAAGRSLEPEVLPCGRFRYLLTLPAIDPAWKDAVLQISLLGDIGQLFLEGELIADHFCNGSVWEIGLKEALPGWDRGAQVTLLITPQKEDVQVDVSSTMAGRLEKEGQAEADLEWVRIRPVLEIPVEYPCGGAGGEIKM